MRPTVLAAIFAMLPIDSAASHCYSVWKYPYPQHCHATALAPRSAAKLLSARIDVAFPPTRHIAAPAPEFSLPDLTDIEWGLPPNDEVRGRLLLRVIMQGKESK